MMILAFKPPALRIQKKNEKGANLKELFPNSIEFEKKKNCMHVYTYVVKQLNHIIMFSRKTNIISNMSNGVTFSDGSINISQYQFGILVKFEHIERDGYT